MRLSDGGGTSRRARRWHRAQGELGSAEEGLDGMCSTPKIKIKREHGFDRTMTTKMDFLRVDLGSDRRMAQEVGARNGMRRDSRRRRDVGGRRKSSLQAGKEGQR